MKTLATIVLVLAIVSFASVIPSFNADAADQPFMKNARNDLNKAKSELRKATPDKGGHRVNAINLVNRAIAQVNAGIKYDRRNSHAEIFRNENAADQPHMQKALDHLRNARENLQKATADKGGHRQNALDLVNQAIDEVQRGIAADRRN
jgi:hypothetical protein